MENSVNANFSFNNQNFQEAYRTDTFRNLKKNDQTYPEYEVYFDIYDSENFYNNNKNSDPQLSEFIFEAEISNQTKHKNTLDPFIFMQSYYTIEDFLEDEKDDDQQFDDDDDDYDNY